MKIRRMVNVYLNNTAAKSHINMVSLTNWHRHVDWNTVTGLHESRHAQQQDSSVGAAYLKCAVAC